MRKFIFIIFLSLMVSFVSCNKKNGGLVEPVPPGAYSYISYDANGTAIVKGWFTMIYEDSTEITGEWHFETIGNPQNIGPQFGNGELIGGIEQDRVWVELNPQFRDNNLQLTGTIDYNRYFGIWQWISFVGVSNQGTFEAVKN